MRTIVCFIQKSSYEYFRRRIAPACGLCSKSSDRQMRLGIEEMELGVVHG